ncbi:MAG: hypothetical protein HXS54_10855 [Theionarchaea archaeon]|nr:hypothetical protein [Theionarchaea archaeon]
MRKMIVLLLVLGLLIGTFTAVMNVSEENPGQDMLPFGGEDFGDPLGDPLPCGGGDNDGGGGGVPG